MDLAAQIAALGAEARRQSDWDQLLYSALADYQSQLSQARITLAGRLNQAINPPREAPPMPLRSAPPPPSFAEQQENERWQRLRQGLEGG